MPSLEETLTCPICLDLFDDPRVLPCSHTFCGKCLHATDRHSSMITCPLCRYHFIKQALPINRIVLALVEQHRQEKTGMNITAKCYDCKSYSKLDICCHCDTLLCQRCHHRHDFEWKNREIRTKNLLLSKGSLLLSLLHLFRFRCLVNWLKYQLKFRLHQERRSAMLNKLQEIELKLVHHRHANNRQQYHETKHLWKSIADDLRQIDQMSEKSK